MDRIRYSRTILLLLLFKSPFLIYVYVPIGAPQAKVIVVCPMHKSGDDTLMDDCMYTIRYSGTRQKKWE